MLKTEYRYDGGLSVIVPCMRCGCVLDGWCNCQYITSYRDGVQSYYNGGQDGPGTIVTGKVATWEECNFCGDTLVPVHDDICEDCAKWLAEGWPD